MSTPTTPIVALAVALGVALVGCAAPGATTSSDAGAPPAASATAAPPATTAPSPTADPTPDDASSPSTAPPAPSPSPTEPATPALTDDELRALGVNELGRVLVAEWHRIGGEDGRYRTSHAMFLRQLQELYDRGYRPVTEAEFLAGTFPIPAGTSPVLLTFDDSTRDQFTLVDGEVPADTAVGMLEAFAATHEGWRATAVFGFNFPDPFGDGGYAAKLRWLVDNGYELSNHSHGHVDLSTLGRDALIADLAENQALLHEVVPDVEVRSLTLPLGRWPEDREAALRGTGPDGTSYDHRLVYLVGADPTRSPHHSAFDPTAIQRVPMHPVNGAGSEWFFDWLDRMDEDALRFVSDGLPDVVTYPTSLAEVADVDPGRTTRTYEAS